MVEHILLEPVQEELLCVMVEASRKKRDSFFYLIGGGGHILHDGLPEREYPAHESDLVYMASIRLLLPTFGPDGTPKYDVSPLGVQYYEHLKKRNNAPIENVEGKINTYLDAERFMGQFPDAYRKWKEAEQILWAAESEEDFTTIGHLCREAMQGFITSLIDRYKITDVDPDKAKTKNRLDAVLKHRSGELGNTEKPFLDALLTYWDKLNDLVQRQEHGAQRDKEALIWEDARRVVFQTAIVMFEIDLSLSR